MVIVNNSWKNSRIYQLWRFIILNFKILKGVDYSKRLPKFVIKYTVSYVVNGGRLPPTIMNTNRPPQVGDWIRLGNIEVEVIEVFQSIPPRGEFCFLQANCNSTKGFQST